jgi:hypothetical protein
MSKRSRLADDPWSTIAGGTAPKAEPARQAAPQPRRKAKPDPKPAPPPKPAERATGRRSLAMLAVRLPPETIDRAKEVAALSGDTLAGLVAAALEAEIGRRTAGLRDELERRLRDLGAAE